MPIFGGDRAKKQLHNLASNVASEFEVALYQEALIVEGVSRRRTPVKWGTLRNSHDTVRMLNQRNPTVQIQVGGPAAPYAMFVHENLEAYHKVGQAKFLESAIREAIPQLPKRLARRVDLNRAAR